jgi:hypothetical protein
VHKNCYSDPASVWDKVALEVAAGYAGYKAEPVVGQFLSVQTDCWAAIDPGLTAASGKDHPA